jgi:hypothetical protein
MNRTDCRTIGRWRIAEVDPSGPNTLILGDHAHGQIASLPSQITSKPQQMLSSAAC